MAANVDELIFNNSKSFLKRTGNAVLNTADSLALYLLKILYNQAQEKILMKQMDEGGLVPLEKLMFAVEKQKKKLSYVVIKDSDYESFSKKMCEDNILHASGKITLDNASVVFYLENDANRVQNVITRMNIEHKMINEVNPRLFVEHVMSDNIGVLPGISDVELEMFRDNIKKTNAVYSVVEEKNNNRIFYNIEEQGMIDRALQRAAWDLNNPFIGQRIRENVEIKIQGRKNLRDAIEGRDEFYIMNGLDKNNYLFVSEKGLQCYRNGKNILEMSRTNKDFEKVLNEQIKEYKNPVALTEREFNNEKVRENIIRQQIDVFPKEYDEEIETSKFNELGSLFVQGINDETNLDLQRKLKNRERKMALDDENQGPVQVADDSISYSEFAVYEFITDDDEFRAREKEFNRYLATQEYIDNHDHIDIKPDKEEGRSVDYLVKKADKIRAERAKKAKQKNKDKERQNDKEDR